MIKLLFRQGNGRYKIKEDGGQIQKVDTGF